jgi:hypothetical protein
VRSDAEATLRRCVRGGIFPIRKLEKGFVLFNNPILAKPHA